MRRVLFLVVLLLISLPLFAGGARTALPLSWTSYGKSPVAALYVQEVWFVSVRSTYDYAVADIQPGDVLVETTDPDAPYLRLASDVVMTCGGPWEPLDDPWIVEAHATKESANARAAWFPWQSWQAKAPDDRWLLVYRNPDRQ